MVVPELTDEDAPVAVSWKVDRFDWPGEGYTAKVEQTTWIAGEDGCLHTRYHDGRQWLRQLEGHATRSDEDREPLTVDAFRALMVDRDHAWMSNARPFDEIGNPEIVDNRDPTLVFSEIVEDGREAAMRDWDLRSREFICVDGEMYRACRQPLIRMVPVYYHDHFDREFGRPAEPPRVSFIPTVSLGTPEPFNKRTGKEWNFAVPLSRHSEAIRFCQARRPTRDFSAHEKPTVHLPEAMDGDVDRLTWADFNVALFQSKADMPRLRGYFRASSDDERLAVLQRSESAWADWAADRHPTRLLEAAAKALSETRLDIDRLPELEFRGRFGP
jgi:hypothetical protein